MEPRDLARTLVRKAAQDEAVVARLAAIPDVADEILGFHAQQAVEKLLKAVLAGRGVAFRRTHDLAELVDAARDGGLAVPDGMDEVRVLSPFGVDWRYGELDAAQSGLDRGAMPSLVARLREWATGEVGC